MNQSKLILKFSKDAIKGKASNMFIEDNELFSYGHHFRLAIRKDYGMGVQFLINGDTYSNSTSAQTRACINGLKPNVQIPFSALRAAGISPQELKIVDFRADKYYEVCKECKKDSKRNADYRDVHSDGSELCLDEKGNRDITSIHTLGAVLLSYQDRFFLSSIDDNEPWRMRKYFICELGKPADTITQAYQDLKPEDVIEAESTGLEIRRQGDIFFIQSSMPTRDMKVEHIRQARLYETSHIATEGRKVWGDWYVRGTVRHRPDNRNPEHAMLTLGHETWWRAVKNTAKQGWSAVGNVD